MVASPAALTHSDVSVSDSSGGVTGGGGGRQPAKAALSSVRLAAGILAAITWPWHCPLDCIVTGALGASTSPFQSTEPPIVNEVASGRFQTMCAASTPVLFSYCGATVRFVSGVTLIRAVAPALVSVIVIPAACVS